MKLFPIIICFVLFRAFACKAEDKIKTVTIKDIISRTLIHNADIGRIDRSKAAARLDMQQSYANFLPSLSAGSSHTNTSLGTKNPNYQEQLTAGASLYLTLFDGFNSFRNSQRARFTWMAAENDETVKKQEIVYSVTAKYIQLYLDSEIVKVEEENVNDQKKLFTKIESFKKAGQKPIGDWLTQKAIVASEESHLASTCHDFELAKLQLVEITGDSSLSPDFRMKKPDFDSIKVAVFLKSDSLLSRIFDQRKDILSSRYAIKASECQLAMAQNAYWPALVANLQTQSGYSNPGAPPGASVKNQFKDNVNSSIGLSLSIPIFDRDSARYAVSRAKLQLEQNIADLQELKLKALSEIRQALLLYNTSLDQMRATKIELESARQALSAAQTRYDAGAMTLTELTSAQSLYMTGLNDNTLTVYQVIAAIAGVGYAAGIIDSVVNCLKDD